MKLSRFFATLLALVAHFKLAQFVDFYQWTFSCLLMTLVVAFKCIKALEHRRLQSNQTREFIAGQATAVFAMIELQATICCGILEVFISQLFTYTKDDGALTWPVLIIIALKCAYWAEIYVKFSNIDEMLTVMLPLCTN